MILWKVTKNFTVLALLLLAWPDIVLAQTNGAAESQKEQVQKFEQLMEGMINHIIEGTDKGQPAEGSPSLQDLMKGFMDSNVSAANGEMEIAQACLSPLTFPIIPGQRSKQISPDELKKSEKLHQLVSDMFMLAHKKEWNEIFTVTREALNIEKDIKEWSLNAPRELYRAELWSNHGIALLNQRQGDRAEAIENIIEAFINAREIYRQALAASVIQKECAFMTANINGNLGQAYNRRIRGEKAENKELALAAYEQALSELDAKNAPQHWAFMQNNLASVYQDRIRGRRDENIERAIAAVEATLTIWTREDFPAAWATAQVNLGAAYIARIRGDRSDNIERAIQALDLAFTVLTRENPSGETAIQNPFAEMQKKNDESTKGTPFEDLSKSLGEMMEMAVNAEAKGSRALVLIAPDIWALAQLNLGKALRKRIKGERAENIERAIAADDAALTLLTREVHPAGWATAQRNLGESYFSAIRRERSENLEKAISAYRAALEIFTYRAFPRDHLTTARLLGEALMAKRDWQGALGAFEDARASFRLLFGQGLNEAEARGLLEEADILFTEAAYTAAQAGNAEQALSLLEDGKARSLAIALQLERLNLTPEERQRLETLRRQISEGEASYEAAQGEDKAVKIAELGDLREELLQLVAGAEVKSGAASNRDIMDYANRLVPEGGALVAPIVSKAGGKLLLVIRERDKSGLIVVDLPQLTQSRLEQLLGAREKDGWLGAYSINSLPSAEQALRIEEWLRAIEYTGSELGKLFGEALTATLSAHGILPESGAQIVILPHGSLGLLPLGLAQHPVSFRYLMADYVVTYAPSLVVLESAANRASAADSNSTLAAISNPTGDLPFTTIEGALIASHFTSSSTLALHEQAATESAVLAALKDGDYWHFASHGFFDWDNPRASGLVLSGKEPLTVGELLDAHGLRTPRLVVLSACETGLYDVATAPNEFTGLPAAFLKLGAGGVLATLWPVNDLSTAPLIARFYDFHRGDKLAPGAALRQAQAWLRAAPEETLQNYMNSAIADGRINRTLLQSLDQAMAAGRARSIADQETGSVRQTAQLQTPAPFEHPYYWGGFTLTGQ